MLGFPRVQKHPLLRGGIKGDGRLKRVNFAPHGTLIHRKRSPQRPKMPIICRIEVRNPSYGGGLPPPHRMHVRGKRSPVIASSFAWRSAFRLFRPPQLQIATSLRSSQRRMLVIASVAWRSAFHCICWRPSVKPRARSHMEASHSGDRHDHGEQ